MRPKTLTRAARDYADKEPRFAVGAGLLALNRLVQGHGYEITGADVWAAYSHTLKAAEGGAGTAETKVEIRRLVATETAADRFVTRILGQELRLE